MTSHTLAETSANVVLDESTVSYSIGNTCTSGQRAYTLNSSTSNDVHHEVTASGDPAVSSSQSVSNFNCYGELTSNQVTTYAGNIGSGMVYASTYT